MASGARDAVESSASDPLPVGAVVGDRYVLRRVLGRGAAAVVYAARHTAVDRPFALKIPLTHAELFPVLCARLRRETQMLARVRHPAIVDIIDAGEHDGSPYLVMELLEGRTLAGLIAARGRLEPDEAIKVGIHLAAGLAAVHAAGMVHRDVKPSNVLVTPSPAQPIRLYDFGVAKLLSPEDPHEPKLTQSGAILGTPEYMSMEALFASEDADHRVDIYALGILLFECLTGAVPVEGTLAEILMRLSQRPLPTVLDVRPEAPPALSALVGRCLEREAGARFQSMAELAAALRALCTRPPEGIDVLRIARSGRAEGNASANDAAPERRAAEVRRAHARAPYLTPTTLQPEGGEAVAGRVEDISVGGVLVIAASTRPSGERVRLRFALPISGRLITLAAEVRWLRHGRGQPAMGLEFDSLPADARAEVERYVELMAG